MLWLVLAFHLIRSATGGATGGGDDRPGPRTEAESVYIAALYLLDADIVHREAGRALSRAEEQCEVIADRPHDTEYQVRSAERRFTAPGHPDGFGFETAALINDLTREHICT